MWEGLLGKGRHCKKDPRIGPRRCVIQIENSSSLTLKSSKKWLHWYLLPPQTLHIWCLNRHPINTYFEINWLEFSIWAPFLCCPIKPYCLCGNRLVWWETHQPASKSAWRRSFVWEMTQKLPELCRRASESWIEEIRKTWSKWEHFFL